MYMYFLFYPGRMMQMFCPFVSGGFGRQMMLRFPGLVSQATLDGVQIIALEVHYGYS